MDLYFGDLESYIPDLAKALLLSFNVTVLSFIAGAIFGLGLALAKRSSMRLPSILASSYIELFRNTPLLIQLYIIYFGIGQLGFPINPLWSTLIGMTLNNAAYTAEIFRAGIGSVPKGYTEAGQSLAMSRSDIFRSVILIPSLRGTIPSLTNQFIILFLYSSVASVISLEELTSIMFNINSLTNRTIEIFVVGAIMYWAVCALVALGSRALERYIFRW